MVNISIYETNSQQIHVDFWDQLRGAASVVLAIYLAGLPQHLGRSRWHLGPQLRCPRCPSPITARTKVLQQMAQLSIRARGGAWGRRLSSRMLQVGTQFQHRFQVKVVISVVKYCPQVWLNYQRKSTVPWRQREDSKILVLEITFEVYITSA